MIQVLAGEKPAVEGLWQRLDPRVKLICIFSLVAVVVVTPIYHYQKFIVYDYYFAGSYLPGQSKILPAAVYFFITFIDFPGGQSFGFLAAAVVSKAVDSLQSFCQSVFNLLQFWGPGIDNEVPANHKKFGIDEISKGFYFCIGFCPSLYIVVSAGSRADDQGQEIQVFWQEKNVERQESRGLYCSFFSFPGIGAQPEDLYSHVIQGVSRCFTCRNFFSIDIDFLGLFIWHWFSFVIGICIGIALKFSPQSHDETRNKRNRQRKSISIINTI